MPLNEGHRLDISRDRHLQSNEESVNSYERDVEVMMVKFIYASAATFVSVTPA